MNMKKSSLTGSALCRLCRKHLLLLIALLAALALLYGYPAVTLAHGEYVSSDPAANAILSKAPQLITVHFAEALVPEGSNMLVYGMNGKVVSNELAQVSFTDPKTMQVTLQPDNSEVYVVYWYNVSAAEGHHDSGSFRFFVNPDPILKGMLANRSMQKTISHGQHKVSLPAQPQRSHVKIVSKSVPLWITGLLCISGMILGAWVMSLFMSKQEQPELPPVHDKSGKVPL